MPFGTFSFNNNNNSYNIEDKFVRIDCNLKTLPKNFLSYASWHPQKILDVMESLALKKSVIIGTNDKRIYDMPDKTYYTKIQNQGTDVIKIEGANHFFDNQLSTSEYAFVFVIVTCLNVASLTLRNGLIALILFEVSSKIESEMSDNDISYS